MENYCPLLLDLRGRSCLVVGGGRVALRKVRTLLKAGARVLVVSPGLCGELEALAAAGKIAWRKESYRTEQLQDIFLALGCSDAPAANRQLAADCRARGLLVNIADAPGLCSFFFPSVLSRGPLSIAVSTEGKSPALARRLRRALEKKFPAAYGEYVHFLGRLRPQILAQIEGARRREALLQELAGEAFYRQYCRLSPAEREEKARELVARYKPKGRGRRNRERAE